jgi:hypothetical protein
MKRGWKELKWFLECNTQGQELAVNNERGGSPFIGPLEKNIAVGVLDYRASLMKFKFQRSYCLLD